MFRLVHGRIDKRNLTVFCVIYNELFFLPAFLDHYRRIGIEQFVFVDDHSTDSSKDFLAQQQDVAILLPEMRFGDTLNGKRAGPQWKTMVGRQFLEDCWAVCVDADEFLVSEGSTVPELIKKVAARGEIGVAAVMVDMYPADMTSLHDKEKPRTIEDLLRSYSFFDRGPYLSWKKGDLQPRILHEGATGRLLKQYGFPTSRYSSFLVRMREAFSSKVGRYVFKVPLVRWSSERSYVNSHTLDQAPSVNEGLALLHFKFTSSLTRKIEWATERRSFNKGSRGYFAIRDMLEIAEKTGRGLTYEGTCRYTSYDDLVAARVVPFCRT